MLSRETTRRDFDTRVIETPSSSRTFSHPDFTCPPCLAGRLAASRSRNRFASVGSCLLGFGTSSLSLVPLNIDSLGADFWNPEALVNSC